MNKITELFSVKRQDILSVYFTAGFPSLNDTGAVISALVQHSADMIEIGIPFSDPLADGPTIQQSSKRALENGMRIDVLFRQLGETAKVNVPLILMGYFNPILQYGVEQFCEKAAELGISGLIIPDLPVQEYLEDYKPVFDRFDLRNIFLITPQTSEKRIRMIDDCSNAFIYMVASSSTTGSRDGITALQEDYFRRIAGMGLKNPVLAGFGISNEASFRIVCEHVNGAVIGSAFIKAIAQGELKETIPAFMNSILQKELTK